MNVSTLFEHHILIPRLTEDVDNVTEKHLSDDKPAGEEGAEDGNKEAPANEPEEKEPEDKVYFCFSINLYESKLLLCFGLLFVGLVRCVSSAKQTNFPQMVGFKFFEIVLSSTFLK